MLSTSLVILNNTNLLSSHKNIKEAGTTIILSFQMTKIKQKMLHNLPKAQHSVQRPHFPKNAVAYQKS